MNKTFDINKLDSAILGVEVIGIFIKIMDRNTTLIDIAYELATRLKGDLMACEGTIMRETPKAYLVNFTIHKRRNSSIKRGGISFFPKKNTHIIKHTDDNYCAMVGPRWLLLKKYDESKLIKEKEKEK